MLAIHGILYCGSIIDRQPETQSWASPPNDSGQCVYQRSGITSRVLAVFWSVSRLMVDMNKGPFNTRERFQLVLHLLR